MSKRSLKEWSRYSYRWLTNRLMGKLGEDDLARAAVAFSPHFDDETLGCGGTIIKKKRAGADVKIVFMSDGSKSHNHLISEDELKAIRAREALAACRCLGLNASDVFFLGFEEKNLRQHVKSATEQVAEILLQQQPEEIFIPYHKEFLADHFATNRIVASALQMCGRQPVIYEYPIWFWYHWPWASVPIRSRREMLSIVKNSVVSGLDLLRDFRSWVYIGDVLELKRRALDQYKSQMTRIIPDSRWMTLGDVADGEFLECFFQDREIFRRYRFRRR
ncbi:MAG: PIG-L deacetylase family protein [Acidiferrobacterales bacterium]